MTTLNPLRIDPRFGSLLVETGRDIAYSARLQRDGVLVESMSCRHPLDAVRDLVTRCGLRWVAVLIVWRSDRNTNEIAGILGDEMQCGDCRGEGMVTLFSTRGTCQACTGRGVHLMVPTNLPDSAQLL